MDVQLSDISQNATWWGHDLQDYIAMFHLTDENLQHNIIDCGAGPASFNAEMTQQGHHVISVDNFYSLDQERMSNQVVDIFQAAHKKMQQNPEQFIWDHIGSFDAFNTRRQQAINLFFNDFPEGKKEGRYLATSPDTLPFEDQSFELALFSHYLFSKRLLNEVDTHFQLIAEACRVAAECRIFPLLNSTGEISPLVGTLMLLLQQHNYGVEIKEVSYRFQKQGNAMLKVWCQTCELS